MASLGFLDPEQPRANHGAAAISLTTSNPVSAHPCFLWPQQPLLRSQLVLTSCSRWEQHRAAARGRGGRLPPSSCSSVSHHAAMGGRAQGTVGDRDSVQRGNQTRINSKPQGWGGELPARLGGRQQGSWEEDREWDLSWRQLPPVSDCMGGPAATGHAGWPRTPPWPGSEHRGWGYPPATLPAWS